VSENVVEALGHQLLVRLQVVPRLGVLQSGFEVAGRLQQGRDRLGVPVGIEIRVLDGRDGVVERGRLRVLVLAVERDVGVERLRDRLGERRDDVDDLGFAPLSPARVGDRRLRRFDVLDDVARVRTALGFEFVPEL
jgi:hypothetical protein